MIDSQYKFIVFETYLLVACHVGCMETNKDCVELKWIKN